MNKTYNNHNDFLKDWCKTDEAKEIQCKVFHFLVTYIDKKDDGKYAEIMKELPEIKLKELDKKQVSLAVNNLVRLGYLHEMQRSRGYNIKISKKGYERWNNKNA
jgi:hypothetical protein